MSQTVVIAASAGTAGAILLCQFSIACINNFVNDYLIGLVIVGVTVAIMCVLQKKKKQYKPAGYLYNH